MIFLFGFRLFLFWLVAFLFLIRGFSFYFYFLFFSIYFFFRFFVMNFLFLILFCFFLKILHNPTTTLTFLLNGNTKRLFRCSLQLLSKVVSRSLSVSCEFLFTNAEVCVLIGTHIFLISFCFLVLRLTFFSWHHHRQHQGVIISSADEKSVSIATTKQKRGVY